MTITLTNLIAQARYKANMETSQFCTDSEITDYLNSSIAELHDLLVAEFDTDYSLSSVDTTTTTSATYNLPTDFYKLKGVDYGGSATTLQTLSAFNFNERNASKGIGTYYFNNCNIQYRLTGSVITLMPAPVSGQLLRLWYTPVATKLVAGSDTLDNINGYDEYVVVDTAIKMLRKEETDTTELMAVKEQLKRRIEVMAANRDAANPSRITDVTVGNYPW